MWRDLSDHRAVSVPAAHAALPGSGTRPPAGPPGGRCTQTRAPGPCATCDRQRLHQDLGRLFLRGGEKLLVKSQRPASAPPAPCQGGSPGTAEGQSPQAATGRRKLANQARRTRGHRAQTHIPHREEGELEPTEGGRHKVTGHMQGMRGTEASAANLSALLHLWVCGPHQVQDPEPLVLSIWQRPRGAEQRHPPPPQYEQQPQNRPADTYLAACS